MCSNAAGTNPGRVPGTRLNDWGRDLCSGGDYQNQTLENNNAEWELCVLCHEWIFSLTNTNRGLQDFQSCGFTTRI